MGAFGVPTLEDLPPLDGKRVLLRADFNVPMKDGRIHALELTAKTKDEQHN